MKKLLLSALFFLSFHVAFCQSPNEIKLKKFNEEILIVRSYEGLLTRSKMSISDGITEIESIKLKNIKPKNMDENLSIIVTVLNLIKKQGYELTHTNSGGGSQNGVFITNYIFEKKE